jgi:hypothetical protein
VFLKDFLCKKRKRNTLLFFRHSKEYDFEESIEESISLIKSSPTQ